MFLVIYKEVQSDLLSVCDLLVCIIISILG